MSASESSVDPAEYRRRLDRLPRPSGFRFSTGSLTFVPGERPRNRSLPMRVALIAASGGPGGCSSALVATRNAYPGAPVLLARERDQTTIRAVVINNKVANVAAPGGLEDARAVAAAAAEVAGLEPDQVLSISTGIIGWKLPVDTLTATVRALDPDSATPREVAESIMTTDRYPKMAAARAGEATVLGIAKGAGMIEPNMATMLAFILTDALVPSDMLQRLLSSAVADTFNGISIDGDQSTSDMVVALASGAQQTPVDQESLERALREVCSELAFEIVRNGEGTAHVMAVSVESAPSDAVARSVARHVANSPLVKTAVYGNDPNVGRLLGATGHALDLFDPDSLVDTRRTEIAMFDRVVYSHGTFRLDGEVESDLTERLQACAMDPLVRGAPQPMSAVPITIRLNSGSGSATILGSDLSYEYVRENADYRT